MVFSDFTSSLFCFENNKSLSAYFERFFKINGCGISAFLSGMAGGFPVGAKTALNLYDDGKISKCECERLMSFSNIPSPAYVISAVGIGILSSYKLGIILYAASVLSALICGFIIGIGKDFSKTKDKNANKSYDFSLSVKNSASASVNLVFMVSFFSAICALIKKAPIHITLKALVIAFAEVANGITYISELCIFYQRLRLAFISFCLSFSGISVLIQSLAINRGNEMSFKKCLLYKLVNGTISFIIIFILPIKI